MNGLAIALGVEIYPVYLWSKAADVEQQSTSFDLRNRIVLEYELLVAFDLERYLIHAYIYKSALIDRMKNIIVYYNRALGTYVERIAF